MSTILSFPPQIPKKAPIPSPPPDSIEEEELGFNEYVNKSSEEICMNDEIIKTKINQNEFSIVSTNIWSLTKHLNQLEQIIENLKPDIICLSEVWKPHEKYVKIKGYNNIITKLRPPGVRGGGVAIYVSKRLKYERVQILDELELKQIEIVAIKVKEMNTIVASLYRPPDQKPNETISDLELILGKIDENNLILTGDMNINYNKKSNLREKYIDTLHSHKLIQFTKAFTRLTKNSATIIDHVVSNINSVEVTVMHNRIADHQMILTTWGKNKKQSPNIEQEIKNETRNHLHYKKTLINWQKIDWKEWMKESEKMDINKTYELFNEKIKNSLVYEKKLPKKLIPRQPWMTQTLLVQKCQLDKLRKKFLKATTEENENEFKKEKRRYNKALESTKMKYFAGKLEKAKKDSKETWRIINEILKRKSKDTSNRKIKYNGVEIENDLETANLLSNYYKSAATNKIKELEQESSFRDFLVNKDKRKNNFILKPITKEETWIHIKSVSPKTSSGLDGIPSKLMNMGAQNLVIPLTEIINKSFKTGIFPEKLKTSKINPVLKREPPEPGNYRPVSQLSCFSKVLEKAALRQLNDYMKAEFSDESQYAYKKHHGTQHAVLLTRHKIEQELKKGKYVCLALIDYSLAFDTLECGEILPEKLTHYGADENTKNWFRSFFTGRKHLTEWNGVQSKPLELHNHSCVQGSCLGAPIFNLYTRDLNNVINCENVMYADDTNYIKSDRDPNVAIKEMNKELETTYKYTTANTLLINKTKTSYMLFKPKDAKIEITEKLKIRETEIIRVKTSKFLGVWLDDKLNFKKQYEEVKKKLEDTVKALICVRNLLNYKTKYLVYNALFKSHIEYCAITYMDKLTKTEIGTLLKIQKKAIRLLFNAKMNVHTKKLFQLSNIIQIDKIYQTEVKKFIYKYIGETSKYKQPNAIRKIIFKAYETENRIRTFEDKTIIKIHSEYKPDQCFYNILTTWNKTNEDMRSAGNLWSLKAMIKEEQMNEDVKCYEENCFTCKIDKNVNYVRRMGKKESKQLE